MRGKSHIQLGHYLAEHYMENVSRVHIRAFLIGCVEPDRNPATYLKGSIHHQWMRGHNYCNASHYMDRIARRLEDKQRLNLFDFYTLGKLIHYTTDAFTLAHNDWFPTDLGEHRDYEAALQDHFLEHLKDDPEVSYRSARSIMDAIRDYHREYHAQPSNIHTDTHFALSACCCVLAVLFVKPI